jgi:cytochrome c-type biogenesis protein CcmE
MAHRCSEHLLTRVKSGATLYSVMSQQSSKYLRFGAAVTLIVLALAYLAYTGVQEGKSYYVTVKELHAADSGRFYGKHLRLVGNVQPGSIRQVGTSAEFVLEDKGETQHVSYKGSEPPPDTFKDNAQALAIGEWGKDGVFHAKEVQAKCASKYATPGQEQSAPAQPQSKGY